MTRFDPTEVNVLWSNSERGSRITVAGEKFIRSDTSFFAMGSCFAVELRKALRDQGRSVFPDYSSLAFDSETQSPGLLPERDNLNHYDTFTIRQEIERALSGRRWNESDFWALSRTKVPRHPSWSRAYQDPYRRHVYAATMPALVELSVRVNACIDEGLASASVVILTLGLTECWRVKSNGKYAALGPSTEEDESYPLLELHVSDFSENYENLLATVNAIWSAHPEKKIVLTVSPVALSRTWTNEDVVQANAHSKATLRAVAGELCRQFPQITYWPSYEFAMRGDVFEEDGRHVRRDAVKEILSGFLRANTPL
jgi:hypothetical protein